jgi:hypothetical protein
MAKRELKARALAEVKKRMPEFKELLGDSIRIPTSFSRRRKDESKGN